MNPFTVPVTVHRSAPWLAAERLRTGRNTPAEIVVQIDPATLSEEARRIWLKAGNGTYAPFVTLGYDREYSTSIRYNGYGCADLMCDAEEPGPADIAVAIFAAAVKVEEKRQANEKEKAERAEQKRKEEAERHEQERRKVEARELLAEEIEKLTKERDYYRAEAKRLEAEPAEEEVDTE